MTTNTNVLTAIREKKSTYNCVTTLKDNQGKVKAVLTGYNQPTKRKNIPTFLRPCFIVPLAKTFTPLIYI